MVANSTKSKDLPVKFITEYQLLHGGLKAQKRSRLPRFTVLPISPYGVFISTRDSHLFLRHIAAGDDVHPIANDVRDNDLGRFDRRLHFDRANRG